MKKGDVSRSNAELIVFGGGMLSGRTVKEDEHTQVRLGQSIALEREGKKTASCTWLDGTMYHGEWLDGLPHGDGRMVFVNGDVYDGTWSNGVRSGFGRWWSQDGDEYSGDWEAGVQHGRGELRLRSGGGYWGDYQHGIRFGFGVALWPGKAMAYVGNFVDDLRHGNGTEFFPHAVCSVRCDTIYDTDKLLSRQPVDVHKLKVVNTSGRKAERVLSGLHVAYEEGELLRGKPHRGELSDGGIFAGQTKDGDIDGRGTITYWHPEKTTSGETSYDGQFTRGNKHGLGQMKWEDGRVYRGSWVENVRCGVGVIETEEGGERYEGEWREDVPDGFGIKTDGNTQELGLFVKGDLHPEAKMIRAGEGNWDDRSSKSNSKQPDNAQTSPAPPTTSRSSQLPSCMRGQSLVELCLRAAFRARAAAGECTWFEVFGEGSSGDDRPSTGASRLSAQLAGLVAQSGLDDDTPNKEESAGISAEEAASEGAQETADPPQQDAAAADDDGVPPRPEGTQGWGSRGVFGPRADNEVRPLPKSWAEHLMPGTHLAYAAIRLRRRQ